MDPAQSVRLSSLLRNVRDEILRFQQDALTIENKILAVSSQLEQSRDFQDLDLLIQSLASLADFISEISDEIPPEQDVQVSDALTKVKLEALTRRLLRDTPLHVADSPADVDNHIEMF